MTNPMQNRPVEVDTHNMVNGYFNTSVNKHDMNYDSSHGGIDSAVYFHSESHRGDEAEEDANVAYQGDVANSHPITATPTGGDVTIQMEPDQPYATRRDVMDSDDNNEDDDDECEEEDDCEDAVGSDFLGALVDSSLPLAERERAVAKEIRHKITGGSTTTNVGTTGAGATGVEEFYRHVS